MEISVKISILYGNKSKKIIEECFSKTKKILKFIGLSLLIDEKEMMRLKINRYFWLINRDDEDLKNSDIIFKNSLKKQYLKASPITIRVYDQFNNLSVGRGHDYVEFKNRKIRYKQSDLNISMDLSHEDLESLGLERILDFSTLKINEMLK